VIVEVHPDPECALSDGDQSLAPPEFARMMQQLGAFAAAAGRSMVVANATRAVA
jgi:3-deoxy-7-phosphoheptulonate synthase